MSLTRKFQRAAWRRDHKGQSWGMMMMRAQRRRLALKNPSKPVKHDPPKPYPARRVIVWRDLLSGLRDLF